MNAEHLDQPLEIFDPRFAVIGIAQPFSQETLPFTMGGYALAMSIIQEQHRKVMPEFNLEGAAFLVRNHDQMVGMATSMAQMALESGDYDEVLLFSHQLFVFAKADIEFNLGGQALLESVMFHREMFDHVVEKFGRSDPYLITSTEIMQRDIEQLRAEGNMQYELILIRGTINLVASNGTLGDKAKEAFDPLSTISSY